MTKSAFFLLLAGLLIAACVNEPGESQEQGATPQDIAFTFHCEEQRIDENEPAGYSVYAIAEEYKVKLAEIDTCTTISKAQYARLRIPYKALAAAGGTSAGAGSYFYALRDNQQISIFQGRTSMERAPVDYELLVTYEDGRYHFHQ
jgi:hypothetical protein